MKVLSLFDGISCGMAALERAGIPVEKYVAFEIDKYAIAISQKNYPQIKQRGNVLEGDFTPPPLPPRRTTPGATAPMMPGP